MAATWPKLADVRAWLQKQPDPTDDAIIEQCRVAAIDYAMNRTGNRWAIDADDVPDGVVQGAKMDAGRIFRRRDSLDGTVAWGDMGVVRIGRADFDVERLYNDYAPVVFG